MTEDSEGVDRPETSQGSVAPPRPTARMILVFGEKASSPRTPKGSRRGVAGALLLEEMMMMFGRTGPPRWRYDDQGRTAAIAATQGWSGLIARVPVGARRGIWGIVHNTRTRTCLEMVPGKEKPVTMQCVKTQEENRHQRHHNNSDGRQRHPYVTLPTTKLHPEQRLHRFCL